MEAEGTLSPGTTRKIIMLATAETVIEIGLIVLLLLVLQWPVNLVTVAIIIFPALPCGLYLVYLVLNDRKKESPA